MSAGHNQAAKPPENWQKILEEPKVIGLMRRARQINRDYDIPYLAGYSEDGRTIYFDRHLPNPFIFDDQPVDGYIAFHERVEKALIDGKGWDYTKAHSVAEAAEEDAENQDGLDVEDLQAALEPYIKADEHEKIKLCPPDLDMTPYAGNTKLITAIRAAQAAAKIK